jgi:predicted PurR-regulated permease PerM
MAEATDSRILRRWFAVAVVVVVVFAIWLVLRPFAMSIAWAAILAFLMFPAQIWLTRRLKGRAALAAGILTALTPIAIFTPLSLLALSFIQQIGALGTALQQNPDLFDVSQWLDPAQNPRVAAAAAWLSARLDVRVADMPEYLRQGVQQWASTVARSGGHAVLNAAGMLLRFFLMLFVLFFILRDGPKGFARLAALLPLAPHKREALFTRLGKVLRAVVYGCGLTALAQGALITIGFAITGLSGPIVFGVLAAVLALLPFGGAALVWVPRSPP